MSGERIMYGKMLHSKTKHPFIDGERGAANRKVLSDLKLTIFNFLENRKYPGNLLECHLTIKPPKSSWEDEDLKCHNEVIDPYMLLDNKVLSAEEKAKDQQNIDTRDIKLYFTCSIPDVISYLESTGLIKKELVEFKIVQPESDEESDETIGSVESDDDRDNTVLSDKNAERNVTYLNRVNLTALNNLHTAFDDEEEKEKIQKTYNDILINYKMARDAAGKKISIEEVNDESTSQTFRNNLSP